MIDLAQAQALLNLNGFPVGEVDGIIGPKTRAGIKHFQEAYAWEPLEVDGRFTPQVALAISKLPLLAPHWSSNELRSKGGTRTSYIRRELLWAAESLREYVGRPLVLASAYRDPTHNRAVGGAPTSLHMSGLAIDFSRTYNLSLNEVKALKLFSGIGYLTRSRRVTHVDVRHVIGHKSTVTNPSTWRYPE